MSLIKSYSIQLDLAQETRNTHFTFSQNDLNTAKIVVTLTNKKVPITLTGSAVKFAFLKGDGTRVYQDATITDPTKGIVEIILNSQVLAVPKRVKMEIEIYFDGTQQNAVTKSFEFNVERAVLSTEAIESSNDLPLIQQLEDVAAKVDGVDLDRLIEVDNTINSLKAKIKRVSVLDYGAKGDWNGTTGTDDTTKINDAINACVALKANGGIPELYFPFCSGYKTTANIKVPSGISVNMDAPIVYTGTSNITALTIGDGGTVSNVNVELNLQVLQNTQSDWTDENSIGIQLANLYESRVYIKQAKKFTIGVQFLGEGGKGNVYNIVSLMSLNGNKAAVDLLARTGGWVNENLYLGGRFSVSTGQNNGKARYGIRLRNSDSYYASFVASKAYAVNDMVFSEAKVYKVTVAGTSGTSAPTHTSGTAVNGTATFQFVNNVNSLNNNVFQKPSLELQANNASPSEAIPVLIEYGYQNTFENCRSESNGDIFARITGQSTENSFDLGYSNQTDKLDDQSLYPTSKITVRRRMMTDQPGINVFAFHNVHKKACYYDGATKTHVAGMFVGSSADTVVSKAQDKFTINDDYLEVGTARCLGVFVDTRKIKRFLIRREVIEGYEGRIAIRCYNAAGAVITNDSYVKGSAYRVLYYDPSYGGVYKTGSDYSGDVFINLHQDVAKIAVLFVNGTNACRIRGFSIQSLEGYHASVSCGYDEIIPGVNLATTPPTAGTWTKGKVVLNDNKSELGTAGSKYVIDAWECLTAGTPGTWIQKRNLTGN